MYMYVYVYSLKVYNEIFEINVFNWSNMFTSEILKIIIFIEYSCNKKYGLNSIHNLNFNLWPKNINLI